MSPHYRDPFTIYKVPRSRGGYVWYYRLGSDPKRTGHSTGCQNKADAKRFVEKLLLEKPRGEGQTLRTFLDPYYVWETCPHARRLVAERKQITRRHVANQRRLLELHVFTDRLAQVHILELRRGDIIDFRDRLAKERGPRTVNKTIAALRAALQEGFYREELPANPALEIGELGYEKRERGTFLPAELQALFAVDPPGPWRDLQAFTCFLLAWANGLRRGELYALRWRHVDLERKILHVDEAWKGGEEIGAPKWGHRREEALSAAAARALEALRADQVRTAPDDLVFADDGGSMRSEQWWRDCFAGAMAAVKIGKDQGIDVRARRLTPHCFRHTINTQLLDEGVDPAKIQATLGWTNVSTQKGYTHFKADHLREPARVVDEFLSNRKDAW